MRSAVGGLVVAAMVTAVEAHAQGALRAVPEGYAPLWRAPMGVNSWDGYMSTYNATVALEAAMWLEENGLFGAGFDHVVADEGWFDPNVVDTYGRYLPIGSMYPGGMLALADALHARGFKFGVWNIRGIPVVSATLNLPILNSTFTALDAVRPNYLCEWNSDNLAVDAVRPAGRAWYRSMVAALKDVGVDFLKVDCMMPVNSTQPYFGEELFAVGEAAAEYGIDVSVSPGGATTVQNASEIASFTGQGGTIRMYRISNDFLDSTCLVYGRLEWMCGCEKSVPRLTLK